MQQLIGSISHSVPTALREVITLGRTLKRRAVDVLAYFDRWSRMVAHQDEAGPTHCPEPVACCRSWRAPNGRRYRIEACEGHRPSPDESSGATA